MPHTNGSLFFKDNIADYDQLGVQRIKEAGGVILGKTNTPEFGLCGTTDNRLGDDCRNPWDLNCTSGGSSGGAGADEGETRNIGEVRTRGLELQLGYDPSVKGNWGFQNPYYFTATYTNAEFMSDVGSTDEGAYENIFTGATKGKEVPNVPQIQFALGTAFIFNKFSINIDGQYMDDVFSTGNNATDELDLDGVADARYGKVDSYFLLDVSTAYKVNPKVNVFVNFRNLTDEVYMTSRLPHGPRAGAPFQIFGGMEFSF